MESYIIKTDGLWSTLKKISDVTEIQIIDPNDFEIAIVFNDHNIEFKEWILEELHLIDGILSIQSKREIDKYNKIYHIQHYFNTLETLCGINGRLGLKISYCEALKRDTTNVCLKCQEMLNTIDEIEAIKDMSEILFNEEERE